MSQNTCPNCGEEITATVIEDEAGNSYEHFSHRECGWSAPTV